jgi:hypothetical protein
MVDEVEETVVRPVQVFEDEHERMLLREAFEVTAPTGERLGAIHGDVVAQSDERLHMP